MRKTELSLISMCFPGPHAFLHAVMSSPSWEGMTPKSVLSTTAHTSRCEYVAPCLLLKLQEEQASLWKIQPVFMSVNLQVKDSVLIMPSQNGISLLLGIYKIIQHKQSKHTLPCSKLDNVL